MFNLKVNKEFINQIYCNMLILNLWILNINFNKKLYKLNI